MEKSVSEEPTSAGESTATGSRLFLVRGFLYPEDGGDTFVWNVGLHKIYTEDIPEDSIIHSHRREDLKSYKKNKIDYVHKVNNFMIMKYMVISQSITYHFIYRSIIEEARMHQFCSLKCIEMYHGVSVRMHSSGEPVWPPQLHYLILR
jgi:hypothetical protein